MKAYNFTPFHYLLLSSFAIVGFSVIPLFFEFPYRINIFLAWEGAYRISEGQIPFKDFGMPLGFGFWIIPALFFKMFGPFLVTLIKAQVFINVIAGFAMYNILRTLQTKPAVIFFTIVLFCLSFSFVNFWPWYNHTVFVYQLLSINFLLMAHFSTEKKRMIILYIFLSALFIFLSIFTKQDGGALAFMINLFIILYLAVVNQKWNAFFYYFLFLVMISSICIVPFIQYDFLYWFNYGQHPHNSRISLLDILNNIFYGSQWIKFYLLMIGMITLSQFRNFNQLYKNSQFVTYTLLVTGILVQALIVQTTSYIPHNVNIYFHSFAFTFILSYLPLNINYNKMSVTCFVVLMIFFWWSSDYWNYGRRILSMIVPTIQEQEGDSSVSINNWITTQDTVKTSRHDWIFSESETFKKILMPPSTVQGIHYLTTLDVVKNKKDLKVLNMSELTPLAHELNFATETGQHIPLWYHKNVAIFDPQIKTYCEKIRQGYYDLVLFEHINYLNNFYPDEIRACLKKYYRLDNKFLAPREIQNSYIEVYLRSPE